ncbi:ATP-grasp domain-containing protein [Blastococcus sp. CT_GayMR20]|uniref:ATP-grasp domain-containing protein n=1 Tax=Blastococcus sp. CT_GayMR20 TaxID=2559609 RepID=UPI00107356DB|nr:ATP-grasp domain-containing protein [Blastococcus sp. CT_GayMR20]TFV88052.1 ATP-grasp domain-containing protein [Blastococcus sp. CT_GayMR20]
MRRAPLLAEISRRIGDRQLVWFGTRGDDVESATELPQFSAAFSIINRYRRRTTVESMALEDATGIRPDLDTFDLDSHPRDDAVIALRQAMLRILARPSVLFTYRPSAFVSALGFARHDRCEYVGVFSDHQSAFEHKPWVESAVAGMGLPHIPWTYLADDDRLEALRQLQHGPIMLRRSRTTGGVGLVRLDDGDRLAEVWPDEDEAFVSVAPFIGDAVPVNVSAVVWHDGVTLHPASIQLIGIPGVTTRRFGYCGNDFAAAEGLGRPVLDAIQDAVTRIGTWLRSRGYIGAFGADFLVRDGVPLFTEVNPRFQGSTHLSCRISVELDESCLLTEHLAACLGMSAPASRSLWELAREAPRLSHVVVHVTDERPRTGGAGDLVDAVEGTGLLRRVDVTVPAGVVAEPSATVARLTLGGQVTEDGFSLLDVVADAIGGWARGDVERRAG